MTRRLFKRRLPILLLAVLLASTGHTAAADWPLTIIDLHHRLPDEVVPLLAPLAGPDGVVTGANGSLFVRASPDRLADLRQALARIDRPARNLLVEVRRASATTTARRAAGISIDEPVGDQGRIRVGPGRGTGIGAAAGSNRDQRQVLQQVRVMDGGEAYIAVGEERPQVWRETVRLPGGTIQRSTAGYAAAGTGFYVRPRLRGDEVTVDISSRDAAFADGHRGAGIATGALETKITGPVGEWLPLGTVAESAAGQRRGLGGWEARSGSTTSGLELRVVPLE